MATIIVSSKSLRIELSKIYDEGDYVINIRTINDKLILYTYQDQLIEINCANSHNGFTYNQSDNRWDWLYKLVSKMAEQPIVMEIDDNKLRISVDY